MIKDAKAQLKKKKKRIVKDQCCVNPDCEFHKKAGSIVSLGIRKQSGRHKQYQCRSCRKQFSETFGTIFANKKTDEDKIVQALKALAEGNTIRGTGRIFKVSKDTVVSWLREAGAHCDKVEELLVEKFNFTQVQVDELWTFIVKKTTHAVVRKKPSQS